MTMLFASFVMNSLEPSRQLKGGDAPIRIREEGDGLEVGGTVPGTESTGIHAVFAEIKAVVLLQSLEHIPVLVSNKAVVRQTGVLPVVSDLHLDAMML